MGRVSGYRTRSGKRVRGYTRGASLGFLRHSGPKGLTPRKIARNRAMVAHGRKMGDMVYYLGAEYRTRDPVRGRAVRRGLNYRVRIESMGADRYYKHRHSKLSRATSGLRHSPAKGPGVTGVAADRRYALTSRSSLTPTRLAQATEPELRSAAARWPSDEGVKAEQRRRRPRPL